MSDGRKLAWGAVFADGDFTKWRQAMRTHGTHPVHVMVGSNRGFRDLPHIAGFGPRNVIYQMITVPRS